jgi:short subunit dehydrogenase-like uncharacterized protein
MHAEPDPPADVIVFGATSFVGQLLVRYLFERHGVGAGADGTLRWAIAGRSRARLEALRASLGPGAAGLPLHVADAQDEPALRALCAAARVIVSTVGPYALHGEPLLRACAESGTDYCDLTGEVQWIRRMLDRYESAAAASGARIVHCCGFDSIPSDLGVHFLQSEAMRRFGSPCERVRMRVRVLRGAFSGGTIASLLNVIAEASSDPALRRELADPYSLCPPAATPRPRQPRVQSASFDAAFGAWTAPFVMGPVNTRIVLRTQHLTGGAYGADFRYDEAMLQGRGFRGRLRAMATSAGIKGFMLAAALGPTRRALQRFVLPAPGEGPSPEAQARGRFDLRFLGTTADGRRLAARVTGDRDPGYGSTAKMLGEAVACLAQDVPRSVRPGGFWTPASIFGDALLARLTRHAGLTFEVDAD